VSDDPLAGIDVWTALQDGRGQLLRAIDGLDDASAVLAVHEDGDWSIADLLTHVAAWDELCADFFARVAGGERSFETVAAPDDQWATWNATRIAEARSASLEARTERLHQCHDMLLEAAVGIAESVFDEYVEAPWGVEDSVRAHLLTRAMHDGEHAYTIREARARSGPAFE